MKTRLFTLVLTITCLAIVVANATNSQVSARQITFVQGDQSRGQEQNRGGLPPEKKKSLTQYGPEDIFPGVAEQEENRGQSTRRSQRSQSPSSRPSTSTTQPALPVATPSPAVVLTSAAKPSPTIAVATLTSSGQQFTLPRQPSPAHSPTDWAIPVLSVLALIVSAALVYVLMKLREKIREGSG